jgi:hypothetical protein
MLSSATVVLLRRRFLTSNDARMTRWPLFFTAYPLLHQVWGLNHRAASERDASANL